MRDLSPPSGGAEVRQELVALVLVELDELGLHLRADDGDGAALLLGVLANLLDVLVAGALVREVVLVDVGGVDARLGGEEHQILHQGPLVLGEVDEARGDALVERLLELGEGVALALFGLLLGVGLGAALAEALEATLDLRHVGEGELEVDDGDVGEGVHLAVDMNDVVVVEASDDVDDGVALADVGEELVAEAGAVRGALDQARDVHKLHRRGDDVRGAADGGEGLEAVVGDGDDAGVRLDGAEGVVGRLREKRAEEERGRESGEVVRERRRVGRRLEHRDARDVAGTGVGGGGRTRGAPRRCCSRRAR